MPLTVQRGYVIFYDRAIATAALRGKHVEEVLPAVGLSISLVETFLAELLATLRAEEVFRVPSFLQGGNAFVENGTVAVSATRRKEIVIIGFAVGVSLSLEEIPRAQFLIAMSTREVFRVPGLTQGRDHLANDRFLAGTAASLLRGIYSLTAHVCLEIS